MMPEPINVHLVLHQPKQNALWQFHAIQTFIFIREEKLKNLLKEKINAGKPAIGTFVGIGHPDVTESLSRIGFDWLLIDSEHAPLSVETMQTMLQAMNGTDCTPIIRPPWNDPVAIKRVLDIGAHGVLLPWINTGDDAKLAVEACRYPPMGLRGFGPRRAALIDRQYVQTANTELLVIPQIETREAVENLDDILSLDGVDACYIGVFDLSLSYGLRFPDFENEEYVGAFDKVLAAAAKYNKPAGMYCTSETVQWALKRGFTLVTVDSADGFLMRGAAMTLKKAVIPDE